MTDEKETIEQVEIPATEALLLQDTVSEALHVLVEVRESLGHVTDVSNDYDMCQMLGNVMDEEIKKIFRAWPKGWEPVAFIY